MTTYQLANGNDLVIEERARATPAPTPAPTQAPTPAPAPAPTVTATSLLRSIPVNLSRVFLSTYHLPSAAIDPDSLGRTRYGRMNCLHSVMPGVGKFAILHFGIDISAHGRVYALRAAYTLTINGHSVPAVIRADGDAEFKCEESWLVPGWNRYTVTSDDPSETCLPYWVWYAVPGASAQYAPVISGTYPISKTGMCWVAELPAMYAPRSLPLAPRAPKINEPTFRLPETIWSSRKPYESLNVRELVPVRSGNMFRMNRSATGALSCFGVNPYFYNPDLIGGKRLPRLASLDGERGISTITHLTDGFFGRKGGVYGCSPSAVVFIDATGKRRTLAGRRHVYIQSYYLEPWRGELVGDWSAVPEARRFFGELWCVAFDPATLETDANAAPINGEHPHTMSPRMWAVDSQQNCVWAIDSPRDSHDGVRKVSILVDGLQDPWYLAPYKEGFLLSERGGAGGRISYYHRNGTRIKVLYEGVDTVGRLESLRIYRRIKGNTPEAVAEARAHALVRPECIRVRGDELHVSSNVHSQIRRYKITDDGLEFIAAVDTIYDQNNSVLFAQFDVDHEGITFGEPTYALSTWSLADFGFPHVYRVNGGKKLTLGEAASSKALKGYVSELGYPTCAFFGTRERAYGLGFAGSSEGVVIVDVARDGDAMMTPSAIAGEKEYTAKGLTLTNGHSGFGFAGVPLPFGVSSNIDAYLKHVGHTQPQT